LKQGEGYFKPIPLVVHDVVKEWLVVVYFFKLKKKVEKIYDVAKLWPCQTSIEV